MIRHLIREPLLHFAVLGGALFSAYTTLTPASYDSSEIVVSSDQITSIAAQFQGTRQRPPSREELAGLVEAYVRDEVFYREGLALGLDRDDPVVRNRVKQKMEILSEDAMSGEPTDADLQKYLDDHREAFELPAAMTFEQVYFDPDRHGERLESDMRQVLGVLRAGRGADGDRTLLPARMERALPPDIEAVFGVEFEGGVRELPVGAWSDALRSSFGYHLVRVIWRGTPVVPSLDDARDAVVREWTRAHTVDARERLYRSLRERYTVTIAPAPEAASARELP
jgi:PPIC-type PPIASE domain